MRRFCCSKSCSGQASSLFSASNNNYFTASVMFILKESKHQIRTIIPPRPVVSTLVYLDYFGRAVRDGVETDLSLIKMRDNKCYLQRVFDTGEIIRWPVPGLDNLKNVTNFETYSLEAIDEEGGISIPSEITPFDSNAPPPYLLAVREIREVKPYKKVTRKDRRSRYRTVHASWKESDDVFWHNTIFSVIIVSSILGAFILREFYNYVNDKPFFNRTISNSSGEIHLLNLGDRDVMFNELSNHPEDGAANTLYHLSPEQEKMIHARRSLYENNENDIFVGRELYWKLHHLWVYRHWPKGLNEEEDDAQFQFYV